MKIVIAGGTGFLGRPLAEALADAKNYVTLLTRGTAGVSPTPRVRLVQWTPDGPSGAWLAEINGADGHQSRRRSDRRRRWSRCRSGILGATCAPPAGSSKPSPPRHPPPIHQRIGCRVLRTTRS